MSRETDDPLHFGELRARAELTLAAILRALIAVIPVLLVAGLFANSTARELAFLGATLVLVLVLSLFAIMALQNLGVELLPLIAGLGVAGAGIALATQGVLAISSRG